MHRPRVQAAQKRDWRRVDNYNRGIQRLFLSTVAGFLFGAAAGAQVNTISVQGNVSAPGTFTVNADGRMTLLEAIGRAGGVLLGSADTATIYRPDDGGTLREIKVPLRSILTHKAPDIALRPGDESMSPAPARSRCVNRSSTIA